MNSVVVLEWTFSPPDYFETRREIKQDDYTMIIADGRVEVKIDSAVYDKNLLMRNALHEELNRRFLGVQLCNYKPYELSNQPTPNRVPTATDTSLWQVQSQQYAVLKLRCRLQARPNQEGRRPRRFVHQTPERRSPQVAA